MTYIDKLKLTKIKTISTITFGFVYYYIWNSITSFCSAGQPYKGKFELFSRGCHDFMDVDTSLNIIKIFSDYIQLLMPILVFYLIYSSIQYYRSK